jgi:hypothetical protein
VVVCFVDICVIVDHHCITFLFNDMEAKHVVITVKNQCRVSAVQ